MGKYSETTVSLNIIIIDFPKVILPPYPSLSSKKHPSKLRYEYAFLTMIYKDEEKATTHKANPTTLFNIKLYRMFRPTWPLLYLSHISSSWTLYFKSYICIL
jgi:hypothetical protein